MQILYLAPIAYEHIRARPQWISVHLARAGHSVFYLNPPFLATSLTWGPRDPRVCAEITETGARLTRIMFPRGLRIGSFKTNLPAESFLQHIWFDNFLDTHNINPAKAAVIVANPRLWWPIIARQKLKNLYYDCQDQWEALSGSMSREKFTAIEGEMVSQCRKVFVTSGPLGEHILSLDAKAQIIMVPNAIDWEALTGPWPSDVAHRGAASGAPTRPVVGLIGSIEHDWVNRELIRAAALKYPQYDFALVGPLQKPSPAGKLLGDLPNVKLVGQVPYREVGKWIRSFYLGIIPFNAGELARATEPIKAYEYMAFGKPVLAHQLPEVEKFGNLVAVTYRDEDFIARIEELVERDRPEAREARMKLARENSWRERARKILQNIESDLR